VTRRAGEQKHIEQLDRRVVIQGDTASDTGSRR